MFKKWVCIIDNNIDWEEEITSTEAYARACYCSRKYTDHNVYIDVRNCRIIIGHFDLG